jgi:hypothetical protein
MENRKQAFAKKGVPIEKVFFGENLIFKKKEGKKLKWDEN